MVTGLVSVEVVPEDWTRERGAGDLQWRLLGREKGWEDSFSLAIRNKRCSA